MTTTRTDIGIRAYRTDDRAAVLQLLTDTMAGGPTGERTAGFFAWKHENNPFGPSLALVAEADDRIVGFRTFMRWRFVRHGHAVHAVRAVDTATHPDHQGRGIFRRLTLAALEAAADSDIDLVFNTPNSRSLPGYRKMGWSAVGAVPIAIRVARPVAFARGLRHRTAAARVAPLPPIDLPPLAAVLDDRADVEALLDAADQPSDRLRTDRDADYLHWRYAQVPGLDYRALVHRVDGRLRGLAIGRPRWRGRLVELTLSEVIVPSGDRATARRLLSTVAACGVDHVATYLAGWPTAERVRRRAGYVNMPGQTMTLVARSVDPDVGVQTSLDDWALSLGDLEVF
jgi:GNAT superfamily N-acetyltransferase